MNFQEVDSYLLSKQGATFDYPFDDVVRVYRIAFNLQKFKKIIFYPTIASPEYFYK